MNDNKNRKTELAVVLRHDALKEIEQAVFAVDGMAKAIRRLAGSDEVMDDEMSLALQHLSEAIQEKAATIQRRTFDSGAEFIKLAGDRIRSAE